MILPEISPEIVVSAAFPGRPVGGADNVIAAERSTPRGGDGDVEEEVVWVTVGVTVPEEPRTERA